jgi:hypothetical protein
VFESFLLRSYILGREFLPLRKKNQSISPMSTKTIRRANKKNASISSMGERLAKGPAARVPEQRRAGLGF